MKLELIFTSSRTVTILLEDGGLYHTLRPYRLMLNGKPFGETHRTVTSLYGLWPDTSYRLEVLEGETVLAAIDLHTVKESCTLNVRRFGAVGDGQHDDTAAIQSAILCCPEGGRVLIPAGQYRVTPLFLKSHITLEVARGATLLLDTDRSRFPILPGMVQSTDEADDYNFGSWEGNPLDMFAAAITGVNVEDVTLCGEGLIDGQAQQSDWWQNHRIRRGAWRGRLLFLNHCRNITVQGLSFANSPSWNLHPYFSDDLKFLDISVTAPADSPNTDGFDPESCRNVLLMGAHFSLGDDCIALKAGKIYMGRRYQRPCSHIRISHCLMENGHGGMTAGSEMAGGVCDVQVSHCLMRNTDRGLRIKTRRGRGRDGVIDNIVFDNVRMEKVGAPFTVNCLYFCDPDGHSQWVQSRQPAPVDDSTPYVGHITFRNVTVDGCGACAGYLLGLPEQPVKQLTLENVSFTFDPHGKPMAPVMAEGVEPCLNKGLVACFVKELVLKNVTMEGQQGDELVCEQVGTVVREG